MDKLKNLLKSDTPTDEPTAGATGKLSGEGSHFSGKGATDAAYTTGPEQGGASHVGTTSGPQTSTREASSYTATNADISPSGYAGDSTGSAAVGQTSTYSSSHLSRGDPTSSVIDSGSNDPLTFKKPESNKEGLAGHENPYRTSSLDPRVDGLAKSSAPSTTAAAPSSSHNTALGTAAGTGVGAAALGASHSHDAHSERTAPAPSTLTTTVDPTERSAEYGSSTKTTGLDEAKPMTSSTTDTTESPAQSQGFLGRVMDAVGLGGVTGATGATAAHERDTSAVADTPSQPTTTTGVDSYTAPTTSGKPPAHYRRESIPTTAYPAGTLDATPAINPPVGGTTATATHSDHSSTGRNASTIGGGAAAVGAAAIGAHEYEQSKGLRENITGAPTGTAPPAVAPIADHATTGVNPEAYDESKTLRSNVLSDTTSSSGISRGAQGTTTVHDLITVGGTGAPATVSGAYGAGELGHSTTATSAGVTGPTSAVPVGTTASRGTIGQEGDHTGRNIALGTGAGAAAVGAGAYGAHEHSQKEVEKADAAHQKAVEEREKAQQKEMEKEQKHHQKEIEKEQKHHQKELEKEHKQHEKEMAAAEKHRQKQLDEEEERRKKQLAAAGVGAGAGAGAGTAAAVEEHHAEKEKKPSIFKRIFKRRKNKETGEDEEYSSDDDSYHHGTAAAGGAAVLGGTAAGTAYEERSGSAYKPSYNPLANDGPSTRDPLASTPNPATMGGAGFVSERADGQPQYTMVPGSGTESSATTYPSSAAVIGGSSAEPRSAVTGLTDRTRDQTTAQTMSQHQYGTSGIVPVTATSAAATSLGGTGTYEPTGTTGNYGSTGAYDPIAAGSQKMGVIEDKHGNQLDKHGHAISEEHGRSGSVVDELKFGAPHTGHQATTAEKNEEIAKLEAEEAHKGLGGKIKDHVSMGGL